MYSLKKCYGLVDNTNDYNGFLVLRPDIYYYEPFKIENIPCSDNTFYASNWGHYHGVNDKHYMLSSDIAHIICNRYDIFYECASKMSLYSEGFLQYVCSSNNIRSKCTRGLKGIRVRHNKIVEKIPCRMALHGLLKRWGGG